MTIERKIDYPKIDVNLINLFPVPLDKSEITDASSDLAVSFKFVDNEGKTVLLIEACSLNIEGDKKIKEMGTIYLLAKHLCIWVKISYNISNTIIVFLRNLLNK